MTLTRTELRRLQAAADAIASGEARAARIRTGLTLREVAEHCGVTPAAARAWELGQSVPRGKPARRYAELLERLLTPEVTA